VKSPTSTAASTDFTATVNCGAILAASEPADDKKRKTETKIDDVQGYGFFGACDDQLSG
jgi:hypothetical protein